MSRRSLRRSLPSAVVSAALVGGGFVAFAVSSAPSAQALTKTEHATKAAEICLAANRELQAAAKAFEKSEVGRGLRGGPSKVARPDDVAAFVKEKALPVLTNELSALRALSVPSENAAAVKDALNAFEKALAAASKAPREAIFENPFNGAHKLFVAAGIPECASTHTERQA